MNWVSRPVVSDTGVPTFIYHGFYRSERELLSLPAGEERYFLPLEQFHSHLDYLVEHRFHSYSVEGYLERQGTVSERSLILTFDDGHISNYLWIWPMLLSRGFRATFFIVADWLDRPGRISREQLREMLRNGISVGSHGLTHTPLSRLSRPQLDSELVRSKDTLEQITGAKVQHLAVPGGFVNDQVLERAQEAGYECVCTSAPGLFRTGFVMHRLSVTRLTRLRSFIGLANRSKAQLAKRWAAYHVLQGSKRLVGVDNYERIWTKIPRFRRSITKSSNATGTDAS